MPWIAVRVVLTMFKYMSNTYRKTVYQTHCVTKYQTETNIRSVSTLSCKSTYGALDELEIIIGQR